MIDHEQLTQESAWVVPEICLAILFPWLDSDCMGDPCNDSFFIDDDYFYDNEEES